MWASKLRLITVEVSSSTMIAGPGMMAPGISVLRSWIATSMKSALSGSNTWRRRAGAGREGGGRAGPAPGVRRHKHGSGPELAGNPRGREGRPPAERDEGAAARILAALDRVDARGVGHVLVDGLADPEGGERQREIERGPDLALHRGLGGGAVQCHAAAGKPGRVDAAQEGIGVGHGGAVPAPA